jgi:hypothetical protein
MANLFQSHLKVPGPEACCIDILVRDSLALS